MEAHELLHPGHVFVKREFQPSENTRNHTGAFVFMTMKSPAMILVVPLGCRLRDIMENSGPSQPQVVRNLCHIVEHLQRMKEVILMCVVAYIFHAVQCDKLRKKLLEQSTMKQQFESIGGYFACYDLVYLIRDALLRNDLQPRCLLHDSRIGIGFDIEIQLRGESYRTHH